MYVVMCRQPLCDITGTCHGSTASAAQDSTPPVLGIIMGNTAQVNAKQILCLEKLPIVLVKHARWTEYIVNGDMLNNALNSCSGREAKVTRYPGNALCPLRVGMVLSRMP